MKWYFTMSEIAMIVVAFLATEKNTNAQCLYEKVDGESIESGFGICNDSGSDCIRSTSSANTDTYSTYLRNNISTSVLTTDVLDLSGEDEIRVDFSIYAVSGEPQVAYLKYKL